MPSIQIQQSASWGTFLRGVDRFNADSDRTLRRMTKKAGHAAVRLIVKNIQASGALVGKPFEPNSQATIELKGSSKPLIDHGDLMGSINTRMVSPYVSFAGVMKIHRSGVNIGKILHEGTNRAGANKQVVIPPRPFISDVAKSKQLEDLINKILDEEMKALIERLFGL